MAAKTIKTAETMVSAIAYNSGVDAAYRKALQDAIRRMAQDMLRIVKKYYEDAAGKIGMDEDPVVTLRRSLKKMSDKWIRNFDNMSAEISQMFANRSYRNLDAMFRKKLRDAGFTVKFGPTARMTSAYRAVVAENVNLIKSIPAKFLTNVQSIVWTNVTKGFELHDLSKALQKEYGITHRRAAFIARDQGAKAKAVFEEARRSELGITEAEWRHSHAGHHPRPTHLEMDRKRYKIAEGMWDSAVGKFVWPGTEPNCRCTSRSIILP